MSPPKKSPKEKESPSKQDDSKKKSDKNETSACKGKRDSKPAKAINNGSSTNPSSSRNDLNEPQKVSLNQDERHYCPPLRDKHKTQYVQDASSSKEKRRQRRSARTRSRDRSNLKIYSDQRLPIDTLNSTDPNCRADFMSSKQVTKTRERALYGDASCPCDSTSRRRTEGKLFTNSSDSKQLIGPNRSDVVIPPAPLSTASGATTIASTSDLGRRVEREAAVVTPSRKRLRKTESSSLQKSKDDEPRRNVRDGQQTETYSNLFLKTQSNALSQQRPRSKKRNRRAKQTQDSSRDKDRPIEWRRISESLEEGAAPKKIRASAEESAAPTAELQRTNSRERGPQTLEQGLPLDSYLEKYLGQSMDFLRTYLRTPAEVLAQAGKPVDPPPRVTVVPTMTPQERTAAEVEEPPEPEIRPLPSIASTLGLQNVETINFEKTPSGYKAQSKMVSVMELMRKFVVKHGNSLTSRVSSRNLLQTKFPLESPGRSTSTRSWRVTSFFERNREKNKLKTNSYAMTFGWELNTNKIRRRNQSLSENFISFLRARKNNKLRKKMKKNRSKGNDDDDPSLEPFGEDYGNPGYAAYNEALSQQPNLPVRLLSADPTAVPTSFSPRLGTEPPPHHPLGIPRDYYSHRHPNNFSSVPSQSRYSSADAFEKPRSWRSTRNIPRSSYDQISDLNSILQKSSQVSEKTHALLEASGRVPPVPLKHQPRSSAPFNSDALLKIYTPKTEFTKQFSALLPTGNL